MQILIVEDDSRLSDVLRRGLTEEGYGVTICTNGDDALLHAQVTEFDAIVLDIMLPGLSGLEVCRQLRTNEVTTPILLLTARDTVDDVVAGLEAGADDYIKKPFAFRELRARLQTAMRRNSGASSSQMQIGNVVLDIASREVKRGAQRIELTNREYQVLEYLMHNPGRVLTRSMFEEHVWGYEYGGLSNTVDVHIKRLRRKLDRDDEPSMIETIRGVGYRLVHTQ